MSSRVVYDSVKAAKDHIDQVQRIDYRDLVAIFERVLKQDLERRAMGGLDINDRAMVPTKREMDPELSRRLGGGPPLAPHGLQSRLVRYAYTRSGTLKTGSWFAELTWRGFDDNRGKPILEYHQHGIPSSRGVIVRDELSHPSPTAYSRYYQEANAFIASKLAAMRS